MYFRSMKGSFTALTSTSVLPIAARNTKRPMRPKPLMPMPVAMVLKLGQGVGAGTCDLRLLLLL
eukprot:CAMPEP_0115100126 /NCGR_PEP_ID=MMETSP0227-20121206/32332_1 /TAXON_ID=89957 /ORGANISM="Polarella glacialis, Strain CCMP 1383" /LENGTH=63 /DNA_ID=CAMNT_0002495389 /DNA_START=33 /DNA_END=220 /DNA_ORIENTATION=-